jgi:beta-N-acetylhexosaminidase
MKKTLTQRVARLFIVGFEGQQPPKIIEELIELGIGGVILFSRNIEELKGVLELNRRLFEIAGDRPFFISLDQEGGRVQRLTKPFVQFPPMADVGNHDDPLLCKKAGRQLGLELFAAGFQLDYAPVLDVDSNPENPVIADRAFHKRADKVARLGVAFGLGLQEAKVAACAKHFPGHGDTNVDSHLALPLVSADMARLESIELVPFRAAAENNIASMMMAHLLMPSIDPDLPTSLSPAAYRLARQKLGFKGLILTDDMEMRAVADDPGVVEASALAIKAGSDGVLVCHQPELAAQAIEKCVLNIEKKKIDISNLAASEERWRVFERDYLGTRPDMNQDRLLALFRSEARRQLEEFI